jgi:hypothetical protein
MTDPTPVHIPDPATDPETVRVTYAELAKARGVSIAAARKLTLRHRWQKQIGNDGLTHVLVPVSFMEDTGRDSPPTFDNGVIEAIAKATTVSVTGALLDLRTVLETVLPSMQEAITSLRVELMSERDRAERAEREVQQLREQLARRTWWRWRR